MDGMNHDGWACVICKRAISQQDSGLCDDHKYDEQPKEDALINRGVEGFWEEIYRQGEERFGPYTCREFGTIDGHVDAGLIVKAVLKAVGTKGISE